MKREIIAYKGYFKEFFENLDAGTQDKILYVLMLLQTQDRIPLKFMIEEGLYELRIEYQSNIYRIFFCFDEGRIVILFNGFQKKTEKTPKKEIDKAKILRKEYYGSKNK
jgi:phage-related protein